MPSSSAYGCEFEATPAVLAEAWRLAVPREAAKVLRALRRVRVSYTTRDGIHVSVMGLRHEVAADLAREVVAEAALSLRYEPGPGLVAVDRVLVGPHTADEWEALLRA